MYSRKSVGPRMEPWGTPALTRYSCEELPSRTTQSCILLRKEEIRPNIWPKIPKLKDLSLWRRPVSQTLSKALDISSATVWVAPDLLKALEVEDLQLKWRSAVDWDYLKSYWKSEKRPHFSRWSTILLFRSFSKTLLNTERRLTGR